MLKKYKDKVNNQTTGVLMIPNTAIYIYTYIYIYIY